MTDARAVSTRADRTLLDDVAAHPPTPRTTATTAVIGLGYVGLPTALSLAGSGPVVGIDISPQRLAAIEEGRVDLLAADHARLEAMRGTDRFRLTGQPATLRTADIVLICVPTPVDDHLGPDLAALRGAC